jgi:protein-L-isoaspartate(D-aspartate) O-methyltransferase
MKPMTEAHFAVLRGHMADVIAIHAELTSDEIGKAAFNQRVMAAMRQVPRHMFVPVPLAPHAYHDMPLPIGFDKTISQPFIVALMTDLLDPQPNDVVLDVGTGLGYQAALLAELARAVWSVEVVEEFATEAEMRLKRLGYENVTIRIGDGTRGWAEHAPFDKIIVAAAARKPPAALIDQLRAGGRLVMPLGSVEEQRLTVFDKDASGQVTMTEGLPVRFTQLETVI